MYPILTVTRADKAGSRHCIDWQLESPQATEFGVNPFALSLSGCIVALDSEVSHLRVLVGSEEVTRISVDRRDIYKKIQSVVTDLYRGKAKLTVRRLAGRLFAGNRGARPPGSRVQNDASNRGQVFDATVPLLALPQKGNMRLEAVFSGGAAEELCRFEYERPPVLCPVNVQNNCLWPLSLTAIGRSGGTWAMHLLSQHPSILAIDKYPYEVTIARDIMEAAVSSCAFGMFQKRIHQSYLELMQGTGEDEVGEWIRHCTDSVSEQITAVVGTTLYGALQFIQRYYLGRCRRVLRTRDREPQLRYIMEKNMRPQRLFKELCPRAREIFLVRDFRDVICSSLAFNAKRGFLAFGREDVRSDRQFVWHRAEMARSWILEPWLERCDTALLVKYEELVRDERSSLRTILEYLELDADPGTIDGMIRRAYDRWNMLDGHMTAGSPQASVGRWVKDLDPRLQEECRKAFAEFFDAFGYDV